MNSNILKTKFVEISTPVSNRLRASKLYVTMLLALVLLATGLNQASANGHALEPTDVLTATRANVVWSSPTYDALFGAYAGSTCGNSRITGAGGNGRNFFVMMNDNVNTTYENIDCASGSWGIRGLSAHLDGFGEPTIRALEVGENGATQKIDGGITLDSWDNDLHNGFFRITVNSMAMANGATVIYEITLPSLNEVTVPSTQDLWLAGMPDGSTASNYSGSFSTAPADSPAQYAGTVDGGMIFTFEATGTVHNGPVAWSAGPDGYVTIWSHFGTSNGIGNITVPINSLIGVFLDDSQPNTSGAPATLDFSTAASRDFLSLSPELKQPFFIGDGLNSLGDVQQFVAPAGATRLFLGAMDAYGFSNNGGEFIVHIHPVPAVVDSDGDGVYDDVDNCVDIANADQADLDGDGMGDVCDDDIDGDGVANEDDKYPTDPTRSENSAPVIVAIAVPSEPMDINSQPVSGVSAAFTDADEADTHTCTVDFGDGSAVQAGTVAGNACDAPDHTYAEAGVYEVTFTVVDNDGGSDMETSTTFIVIYDPSGGFVTGGGWIDSPAGAYVDDPTLVGRANFGFVSKYKRGANVPTGSTEFQFQAGSLNFHSSSYDWLVVAGQNMAKFKGEGTINGEGNYGFMITVVDNGNSGDTFRIKIWDKNNGDAVVYDNQIGAGDDGYDGTVIGGGNIKVHKGN